MSNIYDIFNGRKNAISMISEGFEYEGDIEDAIEDFDSIEEGLEVLTGLQKEMQDTTIKLCAESFVSDLLLEAAMDDDFDEDTLSDMIEESVKEKASNAAEKIQNLWAKIKAWFQKLFENIRVHFSNGEALEKKYNLADKLKADNGKVKCYDMVGQTRATLQVNKIIDKLGSVATAEGLGSTSADYKQVIFKNVGVKDKKELKELVMKCFVNNGKFEKNEHIISKLPAHLIIDYGCHKKDIIDSLKNSENRINSDFSEAIKRAKEGKSSADNKDDKKTQGNIVSVLNFLVGLKTDVIKMEIAVVKKFSSSCLSILRHACGGGAERTKKKEQQEKEQQAVDKAKKEVNKESFDYMMSSLNEDIEFEDDDYFDFDL